MLLFGYQATADNTTLINNSTFQITLGVIAGFIIGVFAAILEVAGGKLLIPTLILLFGADIKLAGSLSTCY